MEKINAFVDWAKKEGWLKGTTESEEGIAVTLSVPEEDSCLIEWEDFEVIPTNIKISVLEERAFGEHIGSSAIIELTFLCSGHQEAQQHNDQSEDKYLDSLENDSPLVWP